MEAVRASSVAARVSEIRRQLDSLSNIVATSEEEPAASPFVSQDEVRDLADRFNLWVGNIGAGQPVVSALSLESRLWDAPEVLNEVLSLLGELCQAVRDGMGQNIQSDPSDPTG